MDSTPAAQDRLSGSGHGPFEGFVEWGHRRVSGAGFFFVCLGIVITWLASMPAWHDRASWQAAIHTVASVLTLLLVVLQENAGRRANETAQEKLNVVAEGVALLLDSQSRNDPELREATKHLRLAVGLEERH